MRIEIVACIAALDTQVLAVLAGFYVHAFWQLPLKLGDDDCLVFLLVVEINRPQRLRNDFSLCHLTYARNSALRGIVC
jgi:hypothetical protein